MRGYRFLDTTIGFTSDAPSIALWLDEFLSPAFDPWTGAADFAVSVRTDAEAHEALAATRPSRALLAEACFALDRTVVRHPGWRSAARTVLADAKYGAFYALDGTAVDVVAQPGSTLFRGGVMRVVREIATARALASPDRVQLHTAACEVDGRAVLLAGPKGVGKTTLLGYLAYSTGARILTNDRAVAQPLGSGFDIRGVPTFVSVRPETRALLPCLFRGITLERPGHLTLAEEARAATVGGGQREVGTRLTLSPPQLARQLGVTLASHGRLAAIVFPEVARDPDGFALERLSARDGARHLLASRFGTSSGKTAPTVFERLVGARRPEHADAALIEAIVARVPCFSVRIGAARFARPQAARTLLGTVLGASHAT